ncbi:alpha/beta hydrolase [bacterium]|nr:alpha/beta hydrolase [bacterium]
MIRALLFCLSFGLFYPAWGEEPIRELYKEVGGHDLYLHVFYPPGHQPRTDRRPAMIFFFGGGWVGGSPTQFYPQCQHLAKRGMVAVSAEYRIKSKHKTTPFECVEDGKSALRWVRANADELGVDPQRIGAGGGSAGGHVAVAIATINGLNDPQDDLSVSSRPDALVLFNPVYDNGPKGFGYKKIGARFKEISPMHNLAKGMPPTIVFLGDEDKLIPVKTAGKFRDQMQQLGNRSELVVYPGQSHGFFNQGKPGGGYLKTLQEMDKFLNSLGWLEKY